MAAPRDRHRLLDALAAAEFTPALVAALGKAGERRRIDRFRQEWARSASVAIGMSGSDRASGTRLAAHDRPMRAGRSMSERRRVAVTGIGLMTALGSTRDEVWRGMLDGRCGIGDVSLFDASGYRSPKAAEIRPLRARSGVSPRRPGAGCRAPIRPRSSRRARRSTTPDCSTAVSTSHRAGVMLGSGTGDLLRNEEWFADAQRVGLRRAPPAKIFNHFPEHAERRPGFALRLRRGEGVGAVRVFVKHRRDRLCGGCDRVGSPRRRAGRRQRRPLPAHLQRIQRACGSSTASRAARSAARARA